MRLTLETIYRRHRQGLFTLALSIVRDPQAAEDAVQDAFSRLWARRGGINGDPVAYVFAAVRNAALDLLRKRPGAALSGVSIFDNRPATAGEPGQRVEDEERNRLLRSAVNSLPDELRHPVVLRLYAGLTFEQTAEALGVPLSTASSRYRKALEVLKEALEVTV